MLLILTACTGSLKESIRNLINRPTYGTILVEVLVGEYSEISDILADSLLIRYPPGDLVVLAYHVDDGPLTNQVARDRAYYSNLGSFGNSVFVDGQPVSGAGGYYAQFGESSRGERAINRSLELLDDAIERELKLIPPLSITCDVDQNGPVLDISIEVIPVIDFYDDPLQLRIAVVEEIVTVPMPSGRVPEYRMVVRDMIGGSGGIPVEFAPDRFQVSRQIDIRQIERKIFNFHYFREKLDQIPEENSVYRLSKESELRQHSRIDLDRIRLVAFVQRETDRAVLQALVFELKP